MKFLLTVLLFTIYSTIIPQNITQIDTSFHNGNIKLSGTLTLPTGVSNPPCVILLTGSGTQTRDENIFGFKIFKTIADSLSRAGIAVFRFDDRGAGKSENGETTATTADYADDALAAADFINSFSEFGKIGLLGHSEGGLASIIAAASSDDIKFIILMAGPTISGGDVTLWQVKNFLKKDNTPENVYLRKVTFEKEIINSVRENKNPELLFGKLFSEALLSYPELPAATRRKIKSDTLYAKLFANQTIAALKNPWTKFFFSYSPTDDLEQIEVPILALYGGKDMQVPAAIDSAALKQVAEISGNSEVKVVIFPNANHLFQKANSGMPQEYSALPKQFLPGFLDSIEAWINKLN